MMWILCIAWLGFSLLNAGWFYAYAQGEYSKIARATWRENLGLAILTGILYGTLLPLASILALLVTLKGI